MKYFEAIYWRASDSLSPRERAGVRGPGSPSFPSCPSVNPRSKIFQRRGYWASKNPRGNTSRDRYVSNNIESVVERLESELNSLVGNPRYVGAIRNNCLCSAFPRPQEWANYAAALRRTIAAKRKKLGLSATAPSSGYRSSSAHKTPTGFRHSPQPSLTKSASPHKTPTGFHNTAQGCESPRCIRQDKACPVVPICPGSTIPTSPNPERVAQSNNPF